MNDDRTLAVLSKHYAEHDEDTRFSQRAAQVEHFVTSACIDKALEQIEERFGAGHVPAVLEIGAATGTYSIELARRGCAVFAVDLLEQHIEVLRSKANSASVSVNAHVADARDLSEFEDGTFDMVLCLGPLYHLFSDEDIRQAISEAARVCRKGGILFLAFLPQDSIILSYFLRKNLFSECFGRSLSKDFVPSVSPEEVFRGFYIDEFEEMLNGFPELRCEHMVAADGMSCQMRESVEALDDEGYRIWCDYCLHVSERRELLGYANHVLWIGTKASG